MASTIDFIDILISEFSDVFNSSLITTPQPLSDNAEYMKIMEIYILLKNLKYLSTLQLYSNLSKSDTVTTNILNLQLDKRTVTTVDRNGLLNRIKYLKLKLEEIRMYIKSRISLTLKNPNLSLPRLLKLCDIYDLNANERELMHVLVVAVGSREMHVLNAFTEEDYLRRSSGFQKLADMSSVDLEIFCEGDRQHVKEGMLTVDEDQGVYYNLRVPRTAVQLFYGRPVRADDMLTVAQTVIEDILNSEAEVLGHDKEGLEGGEGEAVARIPGLLHKKPRLQSISTCGSMSGEDSEGEEEGIGEEEEVDNGSGDEDDMEEENEEEVQTGRKKRKRTGLVQSESTSNGKSDGLGATIGNNTVLNDESNVLKAYPPDNQLEYLEEGFQLIALLVRGNAARIKDDMKKEGTKMNTWDYSGGDVKQGKREIQAKIKLQEAKMGRRVEMTKRLELAIPRLENLCERLQLDMFEKKIVLLLIGKTVSPVVRTLIETLDQTTRVVDESVNVGQALNILCQDFTMQIANRRYFYKSSRLLTQGIISLRKPRWHQGTGDLTEYRITLDRRMLDWTVGLDSEINELVEGSDLYEPKVNLDQVVLPKGHLDTLLTLCMAYGDFLRYKNPSTGHGTQPGTASTDHGTQSSTASTVSTDSAASTSMLTVAQKFSYGNSLVVLLCGKPGTGKTMTVNAVAKHLHKKVLLVDFGALMGKSSEGGGSDGEIDLRGLFRESHMNNAVIFFDECESIFKSRAHGGGDRLLNVMLTEIERHSGIVFLATNRAYELDEAMHRRITAVVEYRPPDANMRRKIWKNLLSLTNSDSADTGSNNIRVGSDVDISAIAVKYVLTGGFIKNAVLSALLSALHRDKVNPVLTQADLVAGCKLQMRGSLLQRSFEEKIEPVVGMDEGVFVNADVRRMLQAVLRFEKARDIVNGSLTWQQESTVRSDVMPTVSSTVSGTVNGTVSSDVMPTVSDTVSSTVGITDMYIDETVATQSQQQACLICLAGPAGSGKKTIAKALSFDLHRSLKLLHISDLMSSSAGAGSGLSDDPLTAVTCALHDARLSDAVVAIDGFENILDETAVSSGWKLQLLLSRLLTVCYAFPGLVVLICHVDSPQNVSLQRDFAAKLFAFVRFTPFTHDVRAKLWKHLIPKNIPLAKDVSFVELGRKFDLFPCSIQSAITRATAEAAMRGCTGTSTVRSRVEVAQRDLSLAAEAEIEKLRSGNFELISKLFT